MFARAILEAIKGHAILEFPKEACGYVAGGQYVPQPNIAPDPLEAFAMPGGSWLRTMDDIGPIQAVIHSHPLAGDAGELQPGVWPDCPSATDMARQLDTSVPWGITVTNGREATDPFWFGDQVPIPTGNDPDQPLVGRPFRHGVTDCYSLIRDWYRLESRVTLREFPRDWNWWDNGQNLYAEGFSRANFEKIPAADVKVGDVFLAAVGSPKGVWNHGGIYLGDGVGLHHPAPGIAFGTRISQQLSRRTPIARYQGYIGCWLRHVG